MLAQYIQTHVLHMLHTYHDLEPILPIPDRDTTLTSTIICDRYVAFRDTLQLNRYYIAEGEIWMDRDDHSTGAVAAQWMCTAIVE